MAPMMVMGRERTIKPQNIVKIATNCEGVTVGVNGVCVTVGVNGVCVTVGVNGVCATVGVNGVCVERRVGVDGRYERGGRC